MNHKQIIKAVCTYFEITESDLKSKKRDRKITYPRHLAWKMMRDNEYTTTEIARIFKGDHSTVVQMTNELDHFKVRRLEEDYNNIITLGSTYVPEELINFFKITYMLTNIEISNARMYSKLDHPTKYQKLAVIGYFIKIQTGVKVHVYDDEDKIEFAFNAAKNFFINEI